MTRRAFALPLAATLVLSMPLGIQAQRGQTPGQQGQSGQTGELSRQEIMRRIEEQFEAQIARELRLTQDQQARLVQVLRDYARTRGEILPRRMELQGQIRQVLSQNGSEDEARRLILEVRALRGREEQLMVQEEERLLEFLQPSQVLLLQFLRDQFGNRIRSLGDQDGPVQFRGRGGGPSPNP